MRITHDTKTKYSLVYQIIKLESTAIEYQIYFKKNSCSFK